MRMRRAPLCSCLVQRAVPPPPPPQQATLCNGRRPRCAPDFSCTQTRRRLFRVEVRGERESLCACACVCLLFACGKSWSTSRRFPAQATRQQARAGRATKSQAEEIRRGACRALQVSLFARRNSRKPMRSERVALSLQRSLSAAPNEARERRHFSLFDRHSSCDKRAHLNRLLLDGEEED